MNLFKYYNRLGFMNPFYIEKDDRFIIANSYERIIKQKNRLKHIDPIAVIEMLNKSYTFGDRTFVEDINLTPWMAKPNKENSIIDKFDDYMISILQYIAYKLKHKL